MVDKSLRELGQVADRAVILEKGRTVWEGAFQGLDAGVRDRYLALKAAADLAEVGVKTAQIQYTLGVKAYEAEMEALQIELAKMQGWLNTSGQRVVVLMEHTAKGEPKLLKRCNLPLTGAGVVDLVVTDLGVFAIDKAKGGMTLIETAPGVSLDEIRAQTEADFTVAGDLKAA